MIVVFILNLVFNHWHLFPRERGGTLETALEYGAVAPEDSAVAADSAPAPNP